MVTVAEARGSGAREPGDYIAPRKRRRVYPVSPFQKGVVRAPGFNSGHVSEVAGAY